MPQMNFLKRHIYIMMKIAVPAGPGRSFPRVWTQHVAFYLSLQCIAGASRGSVSGSMALEGLGLEARAHHVEALERTRRLAPGAVACFHHGSATGKTTLGQAGRAHFRNGQSHFRSGEFAF